MMSILLCSTPLYGLSKAMSDTKRTTAIESRPNALTPSAGDSAVGVPKVQQPLWYLIVVKNNTELVCAEKVSKDGFRTYVPTQTEIQLTSRGQRKTVERRILPSILFVFATNKERLDLLKRHTFLFKSVEDPTRRNSYGKASPAYVTEEEIERMQFMLYKAERPVSFDASVLKKGTKVRVIRGPLTNLEGYLDTDATGTYVAVNISILGSAKTEVNRNDVEPIE